MATNSALVRELRRKLSLKPIQKVVLIGSILGDACLLGNMGEKVWNINYRLQMRQSAKQKDYLWWKYKIFSDWILSPPRFQEINNSWYFRTISHPELTEIHKLFYRNGKKIVPKNICSILTDPLSLAVWIMDDGTRKGKRGLSLSTHNFSENGIQLLRRCLSMNFGLESNVHWDGKGKLIHFPSHNAFNLNRLVGSLVIPSLRYKLPVAP